MTISFCDGKFTAKRDRYQWVLHEHYEGMDKHGNPKPQVHETYHARLEQICRVVIDRMAGECQSMEELLGLLKSAETTLAMSVTLDQSPTP